MINLILTNAYPRSKIICYIKSEILQCQEYQQMENKQHIVQLCIQKASIQEFLFIKFKNCVLKILRNHEILIDLAKFDKITKNLEFILINNKNQQDKLVDEEVELILEHLDYHLSIENNFQDCQKELKSEISKFKGLKYYQNKFNEQSLRNHIPKRFVLNMIFEIFSNIEHIQNTQKQQDEIEKNLTYFFYQEALQNIQVDEASIHQKAKDHLKFLQDCYYFRHFNVESTSNLDKTKVNFELIKDVKNMKFTLHEIYLQFIKSKHQNQQLKNEDDVLKLYREKAFENAEQNKFTLEGDDKQQLDISWVLILHSTIQDFFISNFLLDFLINIQLPNVLINVNFQDWLNNNPNINKFNKYNFSQKQYNGIFKFLLEEVRIRFLDCKLLKLIKLLIGLEDYIQAISNAFYLYYKIFGVFKDDSFENIKLKDITLEGCSFYKVNLNNSEFRNVNITNCNFVYCCLEKVKWKNLIIHNYRNIKINPKYLVFNQTGEWIIYFDEKNSKIFKETIKGSEEGNYDIKTKATSFAISNEDQLLAIGLNSAILIFNTRNIKDQPKTIQLKNEGDILQIAFIKKDQQLIYSNSNKQICSIIIDNLQRIKDFSTSANVNVMTFSSSINVLAFGCDNLIRLYETEENKNPVDLVYISSTVVTLAFQGIANNDLISCDKKGYIRFWDIKSKQNLKVIELYNTLSLVLSPNGKFIAYKDHQDYIKLIDLEYPQIVHCFKDSKDKENKENEIQFSKSENRLALGQQIWDISGFLNKRSGTITCIEISPQGNHYAIGQNSNILICDRKGGIGIEKLKGHTDIVNNIAYSSNGRQLVSVGKDQQVIYWNIFYCQIINQHNHHQSNILSVAITKQYIASGDSNGQVIIYKIQQWELVKNIKASSGLIHSLSFSMDYDNSDLYLASGNSDKCIKLFQLQPQSTYSEYHTFNSEVSCVTFSQDNQYLASCSNDKSIKIWSLREKLYLFSLYENRSQLINIRFTRNNSIWASSRDNTLKLWDIEQKIPIITLDPQNNHNLKSFALGHDDKYLLSLSENDSILQWELNGFYYKEEQIRHQQAIKEIALSPDGKYIAYSGENNFISLCDSKTKQPINHLYIMGVVDQMIFQGSENLVIVIKIVKKDKTEYKEIIKWDIKTNTNKILGEGSKVVISFDSSYIAYAKGEQLNINPSKSSPINTHEVQILCFSPNSNILASINSKQMIIWDYVKSEKKQIITFNSLIKSCSFTRNGELFAYSSGDSRIQFCSTEKFGQSVELLIQPHKTYNFNDTNISQILASNHYLILLFKDQIKVIKPNLNDMLVYNYKQNQILNIVISFNGENLALLKQNFSIEFIRIENFYRCDKLYTANVFCCYQNEEQLITGCVQRIETINLQNSQINQQIKPLDIEIKQIILSKNKNIIAVANEKKIFIIDCNLGQETFQKVDIEIKCITFSSGNHIAYICQNKIKLWDCFRNQDDSSKFRDFNREEKQISLIQFFNNTFTLLIVTTNQLIVFYLETHKKQKEYSYNNLKILVVAISKDDLTIAAGCQDGKIRLWNSNDETKFVLEGSPSGITCLDFHSKSEILASVGEDNLIRIWSKKDQCQINQFQTKDNSKISCIKYHPRANELVFSTNGNIYFWLTHLEKVDEHNFLKAGEIFNYSISGDGKKLAIQNLSNKNIEITDISASTNETILNDITIYSYLKLSNSGNKLAYLPSQEQQLYVYELQNRTRKQFLSYKNKINCIDFSNDEKQLIIAYSDGTVELFSIESNKPVSSSNAIQFIIRQIILKDKEFIQLNIDYKIYQNKHKGNLLEIRQEGYAINAIKIKAIESNKLIVKIGGPQFIVLEQDLKSYTAATTEQINSSLIHFETSQSLWKYRIGFIELNPMNRTFPLIISKISKDSQFTSQQSDKTINEYFNRQYI